MTRAAPFGAAALLGIAVGALPGRPEHLGPQLTALALTAAILAAVALAPWNRLPRWLDIVPPLAYLIVVAILRTSGGAADTSYAPLVLLPVFWFALYGNRRQLAAALGGVIAIFLVPIDRILDSAYPAPDVRHGVLWLVATTVLGIAVQQLVHRQRDLTLDLADQIEETAAGAVRLRAVVEGMQEAFVGVDAEARIVEWNPEAERTFGWTRPDVMGRNAFDVVLAARLRAPAQTMFDRHRSHGDGEFTDRRLELDATHRDGHEFPVELTISPVGVDGELQFTAFMHDISERRRVDAEVRSHKERLEGVLQAATEFSIIGTDRDGLITVFNAGAERMLGYSAHEMIGVQTPAILHDDSEVAWRAERLGIEPGFGVFVAGADGGRGVTREWTYTTKARQPITVDLTVSAMHDDAGEVDGYIGIAVDVTERRRGERALRNSERAMTAVSNVAREISHSDDARQGICNAAAELSEATFAMLLEPRGIETLETTACSDPEAPRATLSIGNEPSGTVVAYTSGKRFFVHDGVGHPAVSQRLLKRFDLRSVLFEPVIRDGRTIGVLFIGWHGFFDAFEGHASTALELLAVEAATAIERQDLLNRLRQLARTDELTGLPNRRSWDIELERELSRATRNGAPVSIAVIDIDHFKRFNDGHGHQEGDRLLKAAAGSWRETLRATDFLARYGGEEFAVLLPDCPLRFAEQTLERVRAATPHDVTCSVGVAVWDGSETPEAVVARADAALYRAKESGRDRVVSALTTIPPRSP